AVGFTLSPAIEDTAPGIFTIDLKGADEKKLPAMITAALQQLAGLDLPATAGLGATPLLALYAAKAADCRAVACRHAVADTTPDHSRHVHRNGASTSDGPTNERHQSA